MTKFKTPAMQSAFNANDAAAFAEAALAYCHHSAVRDGASANRINVKNGLQVQVELLTTFEEMDGGDGMRDGAANSRAIKKARTLTWNWPSLVMTKPTSAAAILDAVLNAKQEGDGVYRTPNGYVVRSAGVNSLPFELGEYADLQYKDGGAFLDWLQNLDFEELPA